MRNLYPELFLNRPLDFQQTRVTEFHNGFRFQVDEMVVLAEFIGALVLCAVVPELVLDDEATVQQQVNRII